MSHEQNTLLKAVVLQGFGLVNTAGLHFIRRVNKGKMRKIRFNSRVFFTQINSGSSSRLFVFCLLYNMLETIMPDEVGVGVGEGGGHLWWRLSRNGVVFPQNSIPKVQIRLHVIISGSLELQLK